MNPLERRARRFGRHFLEEPVSALARQAGSDAAYEIAAVVARDAAREVAAQVATETAAVVAREVAAAAAEARSDRRPSGGADVLPAFPDGHFYSPVVDIDEVTKDAARIWQTGPDPAGIDFRPAAQLTFLNECIAPYLDDYDYPENLSGGDAAGRFYTRNSQFSWLDARSLFGILRHLRPSRMIEVGSGYSSLLTADVNVRFLNGSLDFRCIEPYPRPFLQRGVPGITDVLVRRVQEVDLAFFAELRDGDVLFIDSSHVSKTGSDVNHLLFQVFPNLPPGVLVHIHDIFLPGDYPRHWVAEQGFSWNEQYLVQAFLMHNASYEVLFGSNYVHTRFAGRLSEVLGGDPYGGGSLWLRKTA